MFSEGTEKAIGTEETKETDTEATELYAAGEEAEETTVVEGNKCVLSEGAYHLVYWLASSLRFKPDG